jgi:DnaJ-class molecular chaperone
MNYGDFLVVIHYDIPDKLTEEEKELLEKLKDVMQFSSKQEKLFEKLIEDSKQNEVDY